MNRRLIPGFAMAFAVMAAAAHAEIPLVINHQGLVKVNGVPFVGSGSFKFGLVDAAGFWLWTNDGTHVGELSSVTSPNAAVSLTTSYGIYDVRLGDTTISNMVPIPSTVFDSDDVKLRVFFNDGTNGQQRLTPDQPMSSTAYSFHSAVADDAMRLEGLTAAEIAIPSGTAILGVTTPPPPGYVNAGGIGGGSWSTGANMPTARTSLAVASVNGSVYVIGGGNFAAGVLNEAYHAATNAWSTKAPMPTARRRHAAAEVNGIIYIIGGQVAGSVSSSNEAYDPATNTWSTKAPMPTAREDLALAVVDGVVHAIGGNAGTSHIATHEVYSPATNTWTTKAPMPTARSTFSAATVGGIIYAVGGYNGSESAVNEAYDPATNIWTTRAPLPTLRKDHCVVATAGLVYALGGSVGANTVYSYDPITNTWGVETPMPTGRNSFVAAVVDGRNICAIGGTPNNSTALATTEIHTPHWFVFVKD